MICGTYDRDLAGWFLSTPPSILHSFFSHNEVVRKALGGCSVLGQLWLHNINLKAKVNLKKHWHIHSRCSYSFDSRPTTAALKTHQEIMHFWWKARSSQPLLYSVSKVILGNCQAEEDEAGWGKLPTAKGNEVLHNKVLQSQQPSQFNGFDECLSVCFLIYFLSMSAGILHRCNMFWLFTSHRFLLFCFCPCYPHTSEVRDVTNFHELTRV